MNNNPLKYLVIVSSLILLTFASCNNDFFEPAYNVQDSGQGKVIIHINSEARTALPDEFVIAEYRIDITESSSQSPFLTDTSETGYFHVEIDPGTFTITVEAYNDLQELLATGQTEISIQSGEVKNAQVNLIRTYSSEGILHYLFNTSDDIRLFSGTFSVYSLPSGNLHTSFSIKEQEDLIILPSGYYRIGYSAYFLNAGKMIHKAYTTTAHIYSGHTTNLVLEIDENSGYQGIEYFAATASEFNAALNSIRTTTGGFFVITITEDFAITSVSFSDAGFNNKIINIKSEDPLDVKSISISGAGSLFIIGTGGVSPTLVLGDIKLTGRNNNNATLVRVSGGTLIIENGAEISGNVFAGNGRGAGVIIESNSTMKMYGGNIQNNSFSTAGSSSDTDGGAGVYVIGTLEMYGGSINDNDSNRLRGGGVYIHTDGIFTMKGGEIARNTSLYSDGLGVYTRGRFILDNGEIHSNFSPENSSGQGGGIYYHSGSIALNGGKIYNNSILNGGGIFIYANTLVEINGTVISGNNARRNGGGIYSMRSFNINSGIIENNTATAGGGGIYSINSIILNNGEIRGNTAANGGGIYISGSSSTANIFTMNGGNVEGNSVTGATAYGGGIYSSGAGSVTINSGSVSGNTLTATTIGYGAGLAVIGNITLNGADTGITGNKAGSNSNQIYGGGVYTEGAFTLNDGLITGNDIFRDTGNRYGGGIHVASGGSLTMNGGIIAGNSSRFGGGISYNASGIFRMRGGVISGNTANSGGGIWLSSTMGGFQKAFLGLSPSCGVIFGSEAEGKDEYGYDLKNTGNGAAIHYSGIKVRNNTVGITTELYSNFLDDPNWDD